MIHKQVVVLKSWTYCWIYTADWMLSKKDLDSLKLSKDETSPSTSAGRASGKQQTDPTLVPQSAKATGLDDLAEDVRARVARRVQHLSLLGPYSMDTSSDEEEDLPLTTWCRKPLKLGRLQMADTVPVHKVDWPHEYVYSVDDKPAEYETLSVPIFVSRYVNIMDIQTLEIKALMSSHLAELMADVELYG